MAIPIDLLLRSEKGSALSHAEMDNNWTLIQDAVNTVEIAELITSHSVAANQQPAALDTPLQIEFGAAIGGPSDPVQLDALGNITFNEAMVALVSIRMQFGRTGPAGVSIVFFRGTVGGLTIPGQVARAVLIDNQNQVYPTDFNVVLEVTPVPITFALEMYRDSAGNNSGGLFSTVAGLAGWPDSPTATLEITRLRSL